MSYFVNTAPCLFKSHCIVGQKTWLCILNLPFCWSGSNVFSLTPYRFVGQKTWFFILNSAVLLVRKQGFQFNPLPFYLLERADFHIVPCSLVYESVLTSRFIPTVLFIRRRRFSYPAPWFRLSVCAGFHFRCYYLVYEEWAVSMLKRPLIFVKR